MKDDTLLFGQKDVEILNTEILYQGFCSVKRYTLRNRLFVGGWTEPYQREIVVRRAVAGALPYDPASDQVVLIEQFRAGALNQEKSPWLLEVVAGIMDREHPESHEELIKREVKEEAGLEVQELILMHDYLVSPGGSSESFRLFCAKVDASKAPAFCGIAAEQEDIKIHVLSSQTAFAYVQSGKICNCSAIIALQWLELNLEDVKKQWN